MRILLFSNSLGGLKSFRLELISYLLSIKHSVYILSPIERDPKIFVDLGCFVYPLKMSQRGTNIISELKTILELKSQIKEINPDVILSYTLKPNIYGGIIAGFLGKPIISTITGLGVLEKSSLLQKVMLLSLKLSAKNTEFFYFQNNGIKHFFDVHGIRMKNSSIIPGSGVNLKKFQYMKYPSEEMGIKFIFVGRFLEEKGIFLYLKAAEFIKGKYSKVSFDIVGIPDDKKLTSLVYEFHSKGIVYYHGEQNDVRPFVEKSHCLIHPSFYPEGLSNVLLESSAIGRPVITTDKSGCKEVVEDNITGYIVKQNDLKDLTNKIESFLSLSHHEKEQMGIMARKKVEKEFDRELVIKEYVNRINYILDIE